jgi:hypothetical protein
MNLVSLLSLGFLSAVLFALMLLFGLAAKKRERKPYDLLSFFPYELFEDSRGPYFPARLLQGLLLLAEAALPASILPSLTVLDPMGLSYLIGIIAFSLFDGVTELFLSIVTPGTPRQHLLLFYGAGALLSVLGVMHGCFLLTLRPLAAASDAILVLAIILFILSACALGLIANPALSHWDRLEGRQGANGSLTYVRPRPFVLAFSEWLLIILHLAIVILAAIGYALAI